MSNSKYEEVIETAGIGPVAGCLASLLIIFVTLKLTGLINWSWLWILAPFWVPAVLAIIILLIAYLDLTFGEH
jgi:hypothetical protein